MAGLATRWPLVFYLHAGVAEGLIRRCREMYRQQQRNVAEQSGRVKSTAVNTFSFLPNHRSKAHARTHTHTHTASIDETTQCRAMTNQGLE